MVKYKRATRGALLKKNIPRRRLQNTEQREITTFAGLTTTWTYNSCYFWNAFYLCQFFGR